MTVTEREEKGNSSNTKIVEMKKENVEEEEDINLLLNEVMKDFDLNDQVRIGTSTSQHDIEKALINEEEEDAEVSEMLTKRTRTTESDEAESTIKKAAKVEAEESELAMDPLDVTKEIILKYYDFIENIYQMLKNEEKEVKVQWQKWSEILERGKLLVEDLNECLESVAFKMEWMKSQDYLKEKYALRETHIPDLIYLLRDVNSRIETSRDFTLVSDVKNRGGETLPLCLDELERCKQDLSDMLEVIQDLKELELEDDENGGFEELEDGEYGGLEELELEFDDSEYEGLELESEDGKDGGFDFELEEDEFEELDIKDDEETK